MDQLTRTSSVLVVEDESLVRMLAVDMFENAGFHVIESTSGERALELLKANPNIGSLFTDVELAGPMNGVSLARVIHDKHPDIAIIVVSGRTSPLPATLPTNAHFISKPYDEVHVLRTLNGLLSQLR